MIRLVIWAAVVGCAYAFELAQSAQSVKGGQFAYQYNQGGTISRFNLNNSSSNTGSQGQGSAINYEVGVCYIEVPTATIVRDPTHVPAGNGSRSDLSRIRTCCKGYARNVYNFKICEPVCSQGCVNALCTAPETCTCFPDHVRNLAGFCVATCPIGCQNGHCSGGECLCKEGYKLDIDGRFCQPTCKGNCAGVGNCTAPNACECRAGYRSTLDGSCIATDRCTNGDFVSGDCRCHSGYTKDLQGNCVPHCNQNCGLNGKCLAPNVCSMAPDSERVPTQNLYPHLPTGQNTYNPNYPSPYNQNGSHPTNQGPYHPQYPHPQNDSNTNQGTRPNPAYPYNQGNNPQYPQNSTNPQYNFSVGTYYPLTPGNQVGQNPSYNQGQYPYNPNGQNYPAQGSNYPQNPSVQVINVTYPIPMYPTNQLGPIGSNQPGQSPYANQPGQSPYSNQPGQSSYGQRPNGTADNHGNSQYPSYQQPGYPTPQHGYYPSNEPSSNPSQPGSYFPNGYPSYQNYPYNQQYPYDQTQEQSTSLCSDPCVNAVCIDHNRCRCNPGYITDEHFPNGNRCRPHCPGGCLNGYCAAPHSCVCDEGYARDSSVKGRAVCVKRVRRETDTAALAIEIDDYSE